jgi:hypothetical protein
MGRAEPGLAEAPADRRANAELFPQRTRRQHDAEVEDTVDLDLRQPGLARGDRRAAIEHAANAAHQALQGGAVKLVLAAEAVDDAGFDVALVGVAAVLGKRQVAHHRAVLVAPLRGPEIHAHSIAVYSMLVNMLISNRVPTLSRRRPDPQAEKPSKIKDRPPRLPFKYAY